MSNWSGRDSTAGAVVKDVRNVDVARGLRFRRVVGVGVGVLVGVGVAEGAGVSVGMGMFVGVGVLVGIELGVGIGSAF